MSGRRIKNLNTVPLLINKQRPKVYEHFHFRGRIKIKGNEGDSQDCKRCKRFLPITAFTTSTLRADGAYYLKRECRECHTITSAEHRLALKNYTRPKPDHCDKCHEKKFLTLDHIHGTIIARGWLCKECNSSIGALGDTLEGILEAAIYLEPDVKIVTETFRKVFDKMFARTNESI